MANSNPAESVTEPFALRPGAMPVTPAPLAAPRLRLWSKGILCLLAMVVYVAGFAFYMARDRQDLLEVVHEHERAHDEEFALRKLKDTLALAQAEVSVLSSGREPQLASQAVHAHVGVLAQAMRELRGVNPAVREWPDDLEQHADGWLAGRGDAERQALRDRQSALAARVDARLAELGERHAELDQKVRAANREMARVWWVGSVLGIVMFGALISTFFTRLAADIKTLERRALAVVAGYRGPPLEVARQDEVGGLMRAINRMQSELRHWEQQQELSRQQRFHQEKMAAVGALASAVAHEVMNPIAAIAGMAEEYHSGDQLADAERFRHDARLILAHTGRIGAIMRQLSDLGARHALEPEPLDINALIEGTCSLVRYDKRLRGIDLRLSLDPALPAAFGIADHVTQVLMNLLINAADAMDELRGRTPFIEVVTAPCEGDVMVAVRDNGSGMAPGVLARAFDEFFTTKPPERGTGIGLHLCRTLVAQNGGRLSLESREGRGTTARFVLPALARSRSAA